MPLEIVPYVGVGPLRLEMSRQEVETLLGPPSGERKTATAKAISYPQRNMRLFLDFNDRLREVEFNDEVDIQVDGRPLWGPGILDLANEDPGSIVCGAVLVLPEYGIASTGFHDHQPTERSVGIFRRGLWDDYSPKVKWIKRGG